MAKENQRIALTKRLLKENLLELLRARHIDEISVKELCERAEINRTTFYRYYQTPHDVLLEIGADFVEKFQDYPLQSTTASDIKSYSRNVCGFLFENRELVKTFLGNSKEGDVLFIYHSFFERSFGSRQLLYRGQPVDPAAMELMNAFFAYGTFAILRQWLLEDVPLSPEEVADLIAGSFNQDITLQA